MDAKLVEGFSKSHHYRSIYRNMKHLWHGISLRVRVCVHVLPTWRLRQIKPLYDILVLLWTYKIQESRWCLRYMKHLWGWISLSFYWKVDIARITMVFEKRYIYGVALVRVGLCMIGHEGKGKRTLLMLFHWKKHLWYCISPSECVHA